MWPGILDCYDNLFPYKFTGDRLGDFYASASRTRCRIGAYQKPKAKLTKHRKFIKKMRGTR